MTFTETQAATFMVSESFFFSFLFFFFLRLDQGLIDIHSENWQNDTTGNNRGTLRNDFSCAVAIDQGKIA